MEPIIDVIVPVYRGYEPSRRCLTSILAAPQRTTYELIVIDDASPEPRIRQLLDDLAAQGQIRLHRHAENQGFVASVNAAMALHPERDLVLLNSDTEVANDWLDRLSAHAHADPCIATVTPFSNDATICSYPRIGKSNPMPTDAALAELDALAAAVNAGQSIDLPTGVGFCLFIRRQALNEIGLFDQQRFGRGYGEEVDFCLRAEQAGYRHLLAGDVFVYHQGGASFGAEAMPRKQQAQALIDAEHPDYPGRIQRFFTTDSGRPLRRRLDIARLRRIQPLILFICHARGGGVARHLRDLTSLLHGQAEILRLQPHGPRVQRLSWSRQGEEFTAYLDLGDAYAQAISLLQALRIDRIHYHHVADFPPAILRLPRDLNLAYDFTVHDFAVICPQFHCADANGRYCGEPDTDPNSASDQQPRRTTCQHCLATRPAPWSLDIAQWRNLWHDWLRDAGRIIAPSQDASARLARYWPDLAIEHWPHPEPAAARWGRTALTRQPLVKVLVLGAMSATKGLHLLESCARDARQRELPLFFRVLGLSAPPKHTWPDAALSIAGSYADEHLPDLIASEKPVVLFFPSQVPETFSYTLSVAMHTGLPILATRIGAFVERLAAYPAALLLDLNTPPSKWNQALLRYQPAPPSAEPLRADTWPTQVDAQQSAADAWCADYIARYLQVLTAPSAEPPQRLTKDFNLPRRQVFPAPTDQPPERSLSHLYSAVVEYRDWRLQPELHQRIKHTELDLADAHWERRELKQQLCEARAYALSHLNDERRALNRHIDHLQGRLDAAEAQITAIKNSTTWRLITPLHELISTLRQPHLPARLWQALSARAKPAKHPQEPPGFSFPACAQPHISLILGPTEDPASVPAVLHRLHSALQGLELEILLLDTTGALSAHLQAAHIGGLTLIPAVSPPHFGQHANQAAAQARGAYLLWLDPVMTIDRDAVAAMLSLAQQAGVGLVAPKLCQNGAHPSLLAAGGILWQDGSLWWDGVGDDPAKPSYNYMRPLHGAVWGVLLVKRQLFDSIGGFAPQADTPQSAAVRLCLSIQATGQAALYQPAAEVLCAQVPLAVHDPQAPQAPQAPQDLLDPQAPKGQSLLSNQQSAALRADCADRLADCAPPGAPLARARHPNSWRVLLIVPDKLTTPETWRPGTDNDSICHLRALASATPASLTLVSESGIASDAFLRLREQGIEILTAPYVTSAQDALRQYGPWFDEILLPDRLPHAETLRAMARDSAPMAQLSNLAMQDILAILSPKSGFSE